jgi:pyruvate,water dikinase
LAQQLADSQAALTEALDTIGPAKRLALQRAVAIARVQVPRREVGKAAFLRVFDAARHSARSLGAELAATGRLEAPDDIFYLTLTEILEDSERSFRSPIEERRRIRAEYERLQLPAYWVGDPTPLPLRGAPITPSGVITGIPASPGLAEGRARVILDADQWGAPLAPEEILIARTTDPSWVSMFMAAGGLVVDVGGALSHAAIVARALGIPCVINTGDGTQRIPDGAIVRLDGTAGEVEILKRA